MSRLKTASLGRDIVAYSSVRKRVHTLSVEAPKTRISEGKSSLVFANHQSPLDVPVAIEVTRRLGYRFATWAHPELLRVAPFLGCAGFLSSDPDPATVASTLNATRELLRMPGERSLIWIFPEGGFGHRGRPLGSVGGIAPMLRALRRYPAFTAGIEYSVYRRMRPHCSIVLSTLNLSIGPYTVDRMDLELQSARSRAERFSSEQLYKAVRPWAGSARESVRRHPSERWSLRLAES